jgi:ATP-dependent helicase HrpB
VLPLPVDEHLERVRSTLDHHRALVLTAAPGAGKTTRVPPALVDRGRVLLLQPRRIAARAMARRIADEQGWAIGREIGWHIRFERQFSRDTNLLVVTEGILTACLQDDPLLSTVATVILDEFHERSIHADLGLALAKQAWLARDDLRIVVMSATLDAAPVSAFLDDCPVIDVPGTLHPMAIDYAPGQSVARALDEMLPATTGNVLCFLAGAREIATVYQEAESIARAHDADLVMLHGSLDASEQDAALAVGGRRRITLATNIAETSLTVPGVSVVIDSGLLKVARYDADRAVDALTTERVTLDSADQRAGRAARLGPGTVRRLWDPRDRLRSQREPEIDRIDLSAPLLSILAWGAFPQSFEWFDRPEGARLMAAAALLEQLGAMDDGLTPIGKRLRALPLHPRLARVLIEGGGAFEVCAACAWLSELGRSEGPRPTTTCDLLPIIDQWHRMPPHLRRVADQLGHSARGLLGEAYRPRIGETELRRALLAGYPDRVAKRRNADRVTLATGHGAILGRESGVRDAEWLVALDVTSGPGHRSPGGGGHNVATEAIVRLASRIEPDWLQPTSAEVRYEIDQDSGAVKATEVESYYELTITEHPVRPDEKRRAQLLAAAWSEAAPDEGSARVLRRLAFAGLTLDLTDTIGRISMRARRLADVRITEADLSWDAQQHLQRHAPDRLNVPSGRNHPIEYAEDGSVTVSVKLQELFGLAETPLLGPNRVPVTFHLLAPNGRPVQTTRDLKSFWERTYPQVRKELRGRYPKHPWPEDPWTARATHRTNSLFLSSVRKQT